MVLEIKRHGLPGTLRIVDMANYAQRAHPKTMRARERVLAAAAFVRSMIYILRDQQLGGLKTTVASQSTTAWRTRHMTHMVLAHADERALQLEDDCYYGGRCEAFILGRLPGTTYHLDVSSMYTSIIRDAALPAVLCGFSYIPADHDLSLLRRDYGILADCTIATEQADYPRRDIRKGITVWPVGVYRTALCGPELYHAIDSGRVRRYHRIAWYKMSKCLSSYGAHILGLRAAYRDIPDVCAWIKALGVSIVGKMGQRSRYWTDERVPYYHEEWDTWYAPDGPHQQKRMRSVGGYTQREVISGWSYDAVPAIAAWVTSAGRLLLSTLMRAARTENVWYCDTDSLMVNAAGYQRLRDAGLVRESVPGMLRLVRESRTTHIYGIKDYEEDGRRTRLGVTSEPDCPSFGSAHYVIATHVKGALRRKCAPVSGRVRLQAVPSERYRHGVRGIDGRVTPFRLEEE